MHDFAIGVRIAASLYSMCFIVFVLLLSLCLCSLLAQQHSYQRSSQDNGDIVIDSCEAFVFSPSIDALIIPADYFQVIFYSVAGSYEICEVLCYCECKTMIL